MHIFERADLPTNEDDKNYKTMQVILGVPHDIFKYSKDHMNNILILRSCIFIKDKNSFVEIF